MSKKSKTEKRNRKKQHIILAECLPCCIGSSVPMKKFVYKYRYSIPPHVGRGVLAGSDRQRIIFAELCGIWANE